MKIVIIEHFFVKIQFLNSGKIQMQKPIETYIRLQLENFYNFYFFLVVIGLVSAVTCLNMWNSLTNIFIFLVLYSWCLKLFKKFINTSIHFLITNCWPHYYWRLKNTRVTVRGHKVTDNSDYSNKKGRKHWNISIIFYLFFIYMGVTKNSD